MLRRQIRAALIGAPVGALGGLIGLGGAELRLPLLVAVLGYAARRAVPINLAVSAVTVTAAAITRLAMADGATLDALAASAVPLGGLIAGGMIGAYAGARGSGALSERALARTILALLVGIGGLLIYEAFAAWEPAAVATAPLAIGSIAVACGVGIGLVSSTLGVAGGELIIPTLILLFGFDIKLAGTASLLVSLPTIAVGLLWHHRNGAFADRGDVTHTIAPMAVASIVGAAAGAALVPYVPGQALKLVLGVLLIGSAIKLFRER